MAVRSIGTIAVILNAVTTGFNRGMSLATTRLMQFGKAVKMMGAKMAQFGRTLTTRVTLPIVAALGASVKAFASFDKAMTESLAIMGDVSETMQEEMVEAAKEWSTKSTFSAKELAKSYFFLASAGLSVKKSLEALPVVTKFAQAGAFDLSKATSLLAGSQAALGLESQNTVKHMEQMTRISDVLVKANRLSDATTEQFGVALTRAGGVMRAFGVDLEEGVAVLAAYAKIQRKAEVGGEAFARVLRLMIPAANKNAKAYAAFGIRVFDASGNVRNFADILRDMEDSLSKLSPQMRSQALELLGFQRRMQGAILPLIGMSSAIRGFEEDLNKAAGTTEEVQKKQLKAFANQITIVKNRVVNMAESIGKSLVPRVEKLAGWIEGLTEKWKGMSESQQQAKIDLVIFIAKIGPALIVLGNLLKMLGSIALAFGAIGFAIAGVQGAILSFPFVIAVAGFAAMGAVLGDLIRKIPKVEQKLDSFAMWITRTFGLFGYEDIKKSTGAEAAHFDYLKRKRKERTELKKQLDLEKKQLENAKKLFMERQRILTVLNRVATVTGMIGVSMAMAMPAFGKLKEGPEIRGHKFAAAVQQGTLAGYRAEIGADQEEEIIKVEKNTKEMTDKQKQTNKLLQKIVTAMGREMPEEVLDMP